MANKKGKKALLIFLDQETRKALDALILAKRSKELYTPKECNLQTEGAAGVKAWIKGETDRLAKVEKPTRIL